MSYLILEIMLKLYSVFFLGNFVSLEISNLKLDARRNCYPGKDYMIIENVDGTPISSPICTLIRRNPIRAMAQNALCVKLGLLKVHFLFLSVDVSLTLSLPTKL